MTLLLTAFMSVQRLDGAPTFVATLGWKSMYYTLFIHMYLYMYTYVSMYVYIYIYTYIHMCTCAYIINICKSVYMYTCFCKYTYMGNNICFSKTNGVHGYPIFEECKSTMPVKSTKIVSVMLTGMPCRRGVVGADPVVMTTLGT